MGRLASHKVLKSDCDACKLHENVLQTANVLKRMRHTAKISVWACGCASLQCTAAHTGNPCLLSMRCISCCCKLKCNPSSGSEAAYMCVIVQLCMLWPQGGQHHSRPNLFHHAHVVDI